ncbi:PaaI family thioesterase [Neomegalonema perideroedes]|uniref:PaaI family thioesterase n=1 Tax=Neomegalonema perideroedes TaxID=217219 RepID=UPI000377ABB5|nr:PaaI family thioesterase [Neomegalonema perideroedes]
MTAPPILEEAQLREARREAALQALAQEIPYIVFLGVRFERRGDELTAVLPYRPSLIGNPIKKALHGGAVGAFLEIAAMTQVTWSRLQPRLDAAEQEGRDPPSARIFAPKTIDFSIDYLRPGRPVDAYARARILRQGRRVANFWVEAWQETRENPIAAAHGHFLLTPPAE